MLKRKLVFLIGIVLVLPFFVPQGITATQTPQRDYQVHISKADYSGLNVDVSLTNYHLTPIPDGSYENISFNECGQTCDAGKPSLPTISFYAAIPQGATVRMSYQTPEPATLLPNHVIYPAQSPKPDTEVFDEPPFVINESFYALDTYYPPTIVEMSEPFTLRGCRMVMVTFYPFTYNPAQKTLSYTPDISVSLTFEGGNGVFIPQRLRSIYFQPILDAFVLNHNCLERAVLQNPTGAGRLREDGADLLIVVADQYYDGIQPLAQWRQSTGIQTMVVKWSEIGTTAAALRSYMANAYSTWVLPPSFLLLVGDADQIPVNYLYQDPAGYGMMGTDLWYCAVDGTDYLPDIHGGRISVEDPDQLAIVVNKILDYTETPYMDTNWFNNILLAAYQESGRYFVYTSNRIFNYLNASGYTCNRQYMGTQPPGTTQGVINAINGGVAIANHRDHGAAQNDGFDYTGWSYPQFDTTNIGPLTNGRMYPVMFSMNCDSGWFDGETDQGSGNWESLGEVGLRTEGRGFVAVLASSRVSWSGFNDEFDCGLFDAMFPNFDPNYPNNDSANPFGGAVFRTSEVMNYGKFWMYDKYIVPGGCSPYPWYPDPEASRGTFEEFHIFGDPTMEIRTAFPQTIDATYPSAIPPTSSTVSVQCVSNGSILIGALVCLSQPSGYYARNLTDNSGTAVFNVQPTSRDPVNVVVTAPNCLPTSGTIMVNNPPTAPEINGTTSGKKKVSYHFTLVSTDPENDTISYFVNWGDNSTSGWLGPVPSGSSLVVNHTWQKRGDYTIKVKATDGYGESGWTTLPVTMPYHNSWLWNLFERFIQLIEHLKGL